MMISHSWLTERRAMVERNLLGPVETVAGMDTGLKIAGKKVVLSMDSLQRAVN